jgi:3-dehydroquinate dehydratase/shikimate dehydrogenase
VAVLTDPWGRHPSAVAGLGTIADVIEVRSEGRELDPAPIRRHFGGKLAYSEGLASGDGRNGGGGDRLARLESAAAAYDFVDLEWPGDLSQRVLERVPPERRWISWKGAAAGAAGLAGLVETMRRVPAALFRLSVDSGVTIPVAMQVLEGLGRADVTLFGSGCGEAWSRMLAPWLGAPVVFGTAGDGHEEGWGQPDAEGMLNLAQLVRQYGFPELPRLERLFGIVSRPGAWSLSPLLHNAAYRALGIPAVYLPFPTPSFCGFWSRAVESGLDRLGPRLTGATVTAPHKEEALSVARAVTPAAGQAGGANLLVRRDGGAWLADTTDSSGVLGALARASVNPRRWRVAVIGCGGAGRAAAAALAGAGARVTLVNRGAPRGSLAARLLRLPVVPLAGLDPSPFELIVHATPLCDEVPFDPARMREGAVVLEMVYAGEPTPLVAAARARGLLTIDGWDVLMMEVRDQFRLMTGRALPVDLARELIEFARRGYRSSEGSIS